MGVFSGEATMLYCPKCRQTYEDGSQRFCSNEGARLLPALSASQNLNGNKGVFTSLLTNKPNPDNNAKKPLPAPQFPPVQKKQPNAFTPPPNAKFLKSEDEISLEFENKSEPRQAVKNNSQEEIHLELENIPPVQPKPAPEIKPENGLKPKTEEKPDQRLVPENKNENEIQIEEMPVETKTPARLVSPLEIPSGTADVGDRSANPFGRKPVSREKPKILIGQVVKGRYKIVSLLEENVTSLTYLAEDLTTENKKTVIRVFMEPNADDLTDKILAEERIALSHINHPNIASLLDSGTLPEGKNFIVSEYVEGESLRDTLRQAGTFNPLRAGRVVRQIAHALSEAHGNGILHRSLRPAHVVLTVSDAGKELVKVTDFAVFDGFDEPNEETVKYLAPEQLEGRVPNYASDIYSLAVIAYQMLTGRLPFNYSSAKEQLKAQKEGLNLRPTNLRLDLPPQVDEIL